MSFLLLLYIIMNLLVVKLQHCWGLSPSNTSYAVPIPVRMLAVLASILNTGRFPQIFWMYAIASRRSSNCSFTNCFSPRKTLMSSPRTSKTILAASHTKSLVGAKIISSIFLNSCVVYDYWAMPSNVPIHNTHFPDASYIIAYLHCLLF